MHALLVLQINEYPQNCIALNSGSFIITVITRSLLSQSWSSGNKVLAIGVLSTNPNPKTYYSLRGFSQFSLMSAHIYKDIN
jgi:hypothetical protein